MTSSEVSIRELHTQPPIRSVSRSSLTSANIQSSPSRATSRSNSASNAKDLAINKTNSNDEGISSTPPRTANENRRPSFGLNFLSSFTSSIRSHNQANHDSNSSSPIQPRHIETTGAFMSNSPTVGNFGQYNIGPSEQDSPSNTQSHSSNEPLSPLQALNTETEDQVDDTVDITMVPLRESETEVSNNNNSTSVTNIVDVIAEEEAAVSTSEEGDVKDSSKETESNGKDKDGYFSVRLTPLIDHSSSHSGLYFAPIIRKSKCNQTITIGRYTEKNKAAAHAPQGSDAPIVFKSKVVSRTHALFQCNEEGQWFVKDCKSSSGTFLNHIRLSPASQESSLMPLIDGDIIQLGMDYRGGTEEVYRCVKMRCEFNKSWQRKVNLFNIEIHQKLKNLSIQNPINEALKHNDELSECAVCLSKLEPCQALFISPCSHSWHYKCIRPLIIKSYPQFYCPNCRSMCDLETDLEDEED